MHKCADSFGAMSRWFFGKWEQKWVCYVRKSSTVDYVCGSKYVRRWNKLRIARAESGMNADELQNTRGKSWCWDVRC